MGNGLVRVVVRIPAKLKIVRQGGEVKAFELVKRGARQGAAYQRDLKPGAPGVGFQPHARVCRFHVGVNSCFGVLVFRVSELPAVRKVLDKLTPIDGVQVDAALSCFPVEIPVLAGLVRCPALALGDDSSQLEGAGARAGGVKCNLKAGDHRRALKREFFAKLRQQRDDGPMVAGVLQAESKDACGPVLACAGRVNVGRRSAIRQALQACQLPAYRHEVRRRQGSDFKLHPVNNHAELGRDVGHGCG